MSVYVEFFFRPKTWLTRMVARAIGAPTCGVLRGGPHAEHYPDPYITSAAFVAHDHRSAQIEVFANRHVTHEEVLSMALQSAKALRREGLFSWFQRRDLTGEIRGDVHLK